ncbi:MAG: hypothetical protein RLZZ165_2111 [Bacteroidota bacterium]
MRDFLTLPFPSEGAEPNFPYGTEPSPNQGRPCVILHPVQASLNMKDRN